MSDLSKREVLKLQDELPEEVEECVQSVKADNPDMDKSRAIAICRDQLNMQAEDDDCPNGQVKVGDSCIDITTVENIPPSSLDMSSHRILANRTLAGPIERTEQDDGTVMYKNMAFLDRGVWVDAGSEKPAEYDPEELAVAEDNTLNIAHDQDNEVSEIGHIKADSWEVEDGTGYADVVLDMDSPASEFADENLQSALESKGEVGFGGWSIELPPHSYDLEEGETGYPKVVNGKIAGGGLVMDPASKTTSIGHQTAKRQVAMARALSADSQTTKVYLKQNTSMSEETREKILSEVLGRELQIDEIQDDAQKIADELDVPIGEVMEVLDPLLDMDEEGEGENEEEDAEMEDYEEEEEEEEDTEMQDVDELMSMVESMQERMDAIEEAHEELMGGEEMEAELSEAKDELKKELADAETVEEIDERLSEVENEPKKDRKTLADKDESSWEPQYETTPSESTGW